VVSDDQNPGPPPASAVPTAAVPTSGTPAAPAASGAPKKRRRILLIVAIVVAFLVLLGGSIGVVAYDRATAIDRSTPAVTVEQLLTAIFVEDDAARAGLFLCAGVDVHDAFAQARDLVGADAKPSWESLIVSQQSGGSAVLRARITLRYPGDPEPSGEQHWQFSLSRQDGWRVCSFRKEAQT
jgi:hypothetical protein